MILHDKTDRVGFCEARAATPGPAGGRHGAARARRQVPLGIPPSARAAYLEGQAARAGGQSKDLNPFEGLRGIPFARRRAWDLGWESAR